VILKATNVDASTLRSEKGPQREVLPTLTFSASAGEGLCGDGCQRLRLCKENKLPIVVFNINQPGATAGSWPESASAPSSMTPAPPPTGSLTDHVKHASSSWTRRLKPSSEKILHRPHRQSHDGVARSRARRGVRE